MTRAGRSPQTSSARVVTILMLAVGVSVSACTGTPAGGDRDREAHTAAHEIDPSDVAAGGDSEAATHDHTDGTHDHTDGTHDHAAETQEGHVHDDDSSDAAAVTTGPPRPADPELECGPTILPGGEQITRYCDEGEATFVVGDGEGTHVEGATCEDRGAFFLAHFGANYSEEASARGDYLGLALEEMPTTTGQAPIYALELTLDGYRQPVAEASVDVTWTDRTLGLTLVGALPDGRSLSVEASCHVHDD